ncbi:deoxyribodipyrimidine photo-lyase [Kaistia soli DSM 19436]|uniref:Deoxyribodipyrimidine photo-lyase n=1 Tax=Kaistia soli DSM 19436 TaxID=1122133 RepID=A0A1M5KDH0_9HYPH|nr:deoxyribodipyrimidine photo-lyase [Kaistia soli]SHG50529.1 deoxyribodipyrimidine photo-lyase [Kaistia soli DSM 19436]
MTHADTPALVWFRDDLRLADNPALTAAIESGRPLALVYCLDEETEGIRPLGGAARWWLHHSLERLSEDLAAKGHRLILRRGKAAATIERLVDELGAGAVFWNRRYGGAERAVDAALKARFKEKTVAAESRQANLLFEPWTVQTKEGQSFRVYSPFWRACLSGSPPRQPLPAPETWPKAADEVASDDLDDWKLLPRHPDWSGGLRAAWTPGEAGALQRLDDFLENGLRLYAAHRDEPAIDATSRLSPHLRFGEISPFQLWHAVEAASHAASPTPPRRSIDKFLSELGWREFSWHLLFHQADLATRNFQPRFDAFGWQQPVAAQLKAWQQGSTGFPIVDAGMRQLWQTGWMHNRVRMITASFLIKNLLIDWRIGEAWFWDTLVDADAANNPAGWQWVAGSGADAAPYFRIFNPIRQGETYDSKGDYVRAFVPELANRSAAEIHGKTPSAAGDYPAPIVDLDASRKRALAAFAALKNGDHADIPSEASSPE